MLRFFRQIRQRLIADNKITKYLLYALGEVFLVVIGILIALQINNWNEERKTRLQDREFLNNLKVELSVDIAALQDRIARYQKINEAIKNTLALFDRGLQDISPDEHHIIVSALSQFQILTPISKNSNRNDLIIAQGTIDRIDQELNRGFLTYLEETQTINSSIAKLGETLQQLEVLQIHPNVDYDNVSPPGDSLEFVFEEIYHKRGIKNALQKSYGYRSYYIENMYGKIEDAQNLLAIIDRKLGE